MKPAQRNRRIHTALQAVRHLNCAAKDAEHECCGEMTVGPRGVKFDCALCGRVEDSMKWDEGGRALRQAVELAREDPP